MNPVESSGTDGLALEETLFFRALELPAISRSTFLDAGCAGRPELRARLEALLSAHEHAGALSESRSRVVLEGWHLTDPVVGQSVGTCQLLEKIGEGGCGVVYLAEQTRPVRRRVAVKVIRLGMDTREGVARFAAEGQALARMDHPGIARVFDAGTTDGGRPYILMELVPGVRITDFCDRERLAISERIALFIKVCKAVQHAHQKGVVHRDIKPSNILVILQDGAPVPKVIDFGIAKAIEGRLTDRTACTWPYQLIGTPAYMSPEQASLGELDVDTRSDIYSLGAILYELLTGHPPFDSDQLGSRGLDGMRRVIRETEPEWPSRRGPHRRPGRTSRGGIPASPPDGCGIKIDQDLDWIVMKCLAKDRTRRYETANGLAADLQRFLDHEPVVARPPGPLYRFQKAVRRHRMAFGAVAVVFLAFAVGGAVSLRMAAIANRARTQEAWANQQLRAHVALAEEARRAAEAAADAEARERGRVEELFQQMLLRQANDHFEANRRLPAIGLLSQILQRNPSNSLAASRLVSAVLVPFPQPLAPPLRHEAAVTEVEFSPDGLRVATASWDGTARLWDARTGEPLSEPLRHEALVTAVRFSPDGHRLATASADRTLRFWNADTGEPLVEPITNNSAFTSLEFSPDGSRLAAAAEDGIVHIRDGVEGASLLRAIHHGQYAQSAVFSRDARWIAAVSWSGTGRVWDADTGEPRTDHLWHKDRVVLARFSPDGLRVVTASWDGTARLWDASRGQPLGEPIRHGGRVVTAEFSPDGLRVLTASTDGTARIWDAHDGRPQTEALRHERGVQWATFSPDGLRILTASADSTARVWDALTGRPLSEPMCHEGLVFQAKFSPDGGRVVTASLDGTARVWKIRGIPPLPQPLRHVGAVTDARFSPDGLRVLTASRDGTVRLWDARTGRAVGKPMRHDAGLHSAGFSPDGSRIVTASDDRTAKIWDAETGTLLAGPLAHDKGVRGAQFSPDGSRVVTASDDGTARVWEVRSGRLVTGPMRHGDFVASARFSPDGARIATAAFDQTARIWDARTGRPLVAPLRHKGSVVGAEFSPGGLQLVTASLDHTAQVWNVEGGHPASGSMRHEASVVSARFSPDGEYVVTASEDRTARIWESRSGRPVAEPMRHGGGVVFADFSPDGRRVLTASWDGLARIWDARTGELMAEPFRHTEGITSARFSPDGRWVVTASSDATARVWEAHPAPVPLPRWFLAGVNAWVASGTTGSPLMRDAFELGALDHREAPAVTADDDFYARTAGWITSEPGERPLSPHSMVAVVEYVRQRIDENAPDRLREALALDPGNARAWARWAMVARSALQLPASRFAAEQALRLDSRNAEAWRALGLVQAQTGDWTEAGRIAREGLGHQPDDGRSWQLLSGALRHEGRLAEAVEALRTGIDRLSRTGMEAFLDRMSLLTDLVALVPPTVLPGGNAPAGHAAIRQSLALCSEISGGLAAEDGRRVLQAWERLATAGSVSGHSDVRSLALDAYVETLRRCVSAMPADAEHVAHLAAISLWLGRLREYEELCRRLVGLETQWGDPKTSYNAFKTCLLRPPQDGGLHERAVHLARPYLDALPLHDPGRPQLTVAAALASVRKGQPREAVLLLAEVTARESPPPDSQDLALACRALARLHLGQSDAAREDLVALDSTLGHFPGRPSLSLLVLRSDALGARILSDEARERMRADLSLIGP
ncbi:MAG: protein kinase [Verrucomicrobiae bacterium]|nr:protein kinase [Verrucomicrobiae bacterium]